jgi:hypothetical protein
MVTDSEAGLLQNDEKLSSDIRVLFFVFSYFRVFVINFLFFVPACPGGTNEKKV